jgi:integrase/recombinase XerD
MAESNMYQREGVWWLRVEIDGRKHRESLRTSSVREARKLRDERLKELQGSMRRRERTHSWQEAAMAWAGHIKGQVAATTAQRYAVSLKQCEDHLIPLTIEKIDSKAVSSLIQARRAAGSSPATIRRDLTAVSSVIEFAAGMGWTEGNATLQQRRRLRERRDPIVLPTDDGIEAVVEAAGPRFGAIIIAARLTGCRQAELVAAKWPQFNDGAGTLEIVGKGNKRRVIALSPAALAHFRFLPRHAENIFALG